jgi:hypothetical protein
MKTVRGDLPGVLDEGPEPFRRVYRAPIVRPLGSVQKLTLNMGTLQQTDNITHLTGKTAAV